MDRPGVCQVPEGSGEQGKMEETGCEVICGTPMTLAVKGLMRERLSEARSLYGAKTLGKMPLVTSLDLCKSFLGRSTLQVLCKVA